MERALDDADELAAYEGPLLVEETELVQTAPALVLEQCARCAHARSVAASTPWCIEVRYASEVQADTEGTTDFGYRFTSFTFLSLAGL